MHATHTIRSRDIKGGNIFIAPNGIVKIGDLGASVSLSKVDASIPGDAPLQVGVSVMPFFTTINPFGTYALMKGSPFWMAPEVVLQVRQSGHQSVWIVTRCHMSNVTHHTSHITHHTSHITRHTSRITHHTSRITHHHHPSHHPTCL